MSNVPYLGPRASFLLGMLGSPMTAGELYRMAERSLDVLNGGGEDFEEDVTRFADAISGVSGGSPRLAIEGLLDGGEGLLREQLCRLKAVGLVTCQSGGGGPGEALWWRT